jgi:Ca2+-binding RTX toxin-like protein
LASVASGGVGTLATAAEIFADEGKLAFLMSLSSASMRLRSVDTDPTDHVNTVEKAKSGVNAPTVAFEAAGWKVATEHLTMLNAVDMPTLKPVKSSSKNFPSVGLESGIFTNKNGAALVARSDDALFVAFRGSNDIDGGIGRSPDSSQWDIDKRDDHYKLFNKLTKAIETYVAEHPEITKVYITGHSLGGGMVNAFMQSHPGSIYEAVSFGSIRYGHGASQADDRVTNVWNDADIALALGGRADGDSIKFKVVGPDSISEHMPWLYQAEIKFVSHLGYDIEDLTGYHRIVLGATATGLFSSGIGISNDELAGTGRKDLMLGGRGSDRMQGLAGADRIDGGEGSHDAAIYSEKHVGIDVTLDGDFWIDVLVGGVAEDRIRSVEDIAGGFGNDTIIGDARSNYLAGNGGNDWLDGADGNDVLYGGLGRDTLIGSDGRDFFVFDTRPGRADADVIFDFTPGQDKIRLDADIYDAIGNTLNVKEFYAAAGATKAHDRTDHIVYNTDNGKLYYDADGKGGHSSVLIAKLEDAPILTSHQFDIV